MQNDKYKEFRNFMVNDEACEAYRLCSAQTTRHRAQIMAAEESGYEKGLADGRAGQLVPADGGWIVGNGSGDKWRKWSPAFGPVWTSDRDKAVRYARRCDAEAVHAADEDAWHIVPYRKQGGDDAQG